MGGLIVHEWVETHGGAENVVDAMVGAFPDAELLCLWNDAPDRFRDVHVHESWLSKSPLRRNKAIALPLMSQTWRRQSLDGREWALVSSHLFAHHVAAGRSARDVPVYVYAHTPARYIWEPTLDGRGSHPVIRAASRYYRYIDKRAAASGAHFAANSDFVRRRIEKSWHQESRVIYPPVQIEELQSERDWTRLLHGAEADVFATLPDNFVLGASRFVPYKNLPRVIDVGEACGLPVVLAGGGPQLDELRSHAARSDVPVFIIEQPSNVLLYSLYQRASLFVFPPIEDFGIMPVEAMALGTPVLVNEVGGAAESARLLGGGVECSFASPRHEVREAVDLALNLDMAAAAAAASQFSTETFQRRLKAWMASDLN